MYLYINSLEQRKGCISKKPCFAKIRSKKFLEILPSFLAQAKQ